MQDKISTAHGEQDQAHAPQGPFYALSTSVQAFARLAQLQERVRYSHIARRSERSTRTSISIPTSSTPPKRPPASYNSKAAFLALQRA